MQIDGTGRVAVGANPASAIFDLQGLALADDTYRVRLLGNGANVIMDMDANALDGEYLGVFPSGNGAAGGDFVVTFTVTTPVVIGPTLDQIQAVVFTPQCASCHTGAGAVLPGSMNLSDADASHLNLVNIDSVNEPGIIRVVPGDPDSKARTRSEASCRPAVCCRRPRSTRSASGSPTARCADYLTAFLT